MSHQRYTQAFLDDAYVRLLGGHVGEAMSLLHGGLHEVRRALPSAEWQLIGRGTIINHPIKELLHRDWFTRRAYEKPRGYAGDAELLDFLYQESVALHAPGGCVGGAIGHFLHGQTSARSVRSRRALLASLIDHVAAERPHARVLSVACGHLREGLTSRAVRSGALGELVGFDQDPQSLAVVQQSLGPHGVTTVKGTVRALLTGRAGLGTFDLVYSAGLYDYLPEAAAARLTRVLFGMLNPGGRLLVANFAEHPPESGYMETFMDWWLIHRTEAQMHALKAEIPRAELAGEELFEDPHRNVLYLQLTRS